MLRSHARISFALLYAVCVILSLCVYSRAFDNSFSADDLVFLRHVETSLLQDDFRPSTDFAFYRPGALALFRLEHKLFVRNGGAYIMFNYALHVVISVLMLLVLLRIDRNRKIAFLASGLFLVGFGHYGKQVMWACTSGSLASVLLSLVSILITLQWLESNTYDKVTTAKLNYVARPTFVLVLLTVSPLFHEASLLTPVAVAFIVGVSLRTSYTSMLRYVFFFLLPLPLWFLLLSLLSRSYAAYTQIGEIILNVPLYLVRYMGFVVFPLQRTGILESTPALDLVIRIGQGIHVVIGLTLLVLLLYLVLRSRMGLRILSAWFLLALVPFAFVQMPDSWLELRYLYYASIPFCGLAAIAVLALLSRPRVCWKVIAYALIIGATLGSMLLTLLLERQYEHYLRTHTVSYRVSRGLPLYGSR